MLNNQEEISSDCLSQSSLPKKKAIVLLSGGLDSATVAAIAKPDYCLYGISFSYGQRHAVELEAAQKVADFFGMMVHKTIPIDLRAFGGSALTDNIAVPKGRDLTTMEENDIPITYVPARNTVFLSYALAFAETVGAFDIFIGVNALDYSGYPDCRQEFLDAFQHLANVATAASVKGEGKYKIHAPLLNLTKAEIIARGLELGVDYSITRSCYDPDPVGHACGHCDSCQLRLKGFAANGLLDPAPYQPNLAA